MIIKGKVYDVTSYVEEHPGGDAILRNAGCAPVAQPVPLPAPICAVSRLLSRDSTKGFMGPQHPTRVYDIIEDFCIGTCKEEQEELEESKKDA